MQTWRELRFRGFWHVCLTGLSALFVIASAAAFMSGTTQVTQLPSVADAAVAPARAFAPAAASGHAYDGAAAHAAREAADKRRLLHRLHRLHFLHVQALEARAKAAKEAAEHAAWLARQPKPHFSALSATAAPATASARVSVSGPLTTAAVESLWDQAGGPSWAAPKAAEIAYCESGYNPRAYNPSGATGLWQILGSVIPGDLDNPYVNALNAVAKFKAGGDTFSAWVCQ
jgi:hypothetical protein